MGPDIGVNHSIVFLAFENMGIYAEIGFLRHTIKTYSILVYDNNTLAVMVVITAEFWGDCLENANF